MTKDSIRSNLSVFASDIMAVRKKGLEYVLGETNSYACHVSDDTCYMDEEANICVSLNPAGRSWCKQYGWCGTLDAGLPLLCVCPLRFRVHLTIYYPFISSQLGISRVYFHQGIGYKYNLVSMPISLPRPLFNTLVDPTRDPFPFTS